jgi:hypothetical protein
VLNLRFDAIYGHEYNSFDAARSRALEKAGDNSGLQNLLVVDKDQFEEPEGRE